MKTSAIAAALSAASVAFVASGAHAHSASDAYLTLSTDANGTIHGQWDIALRDLDFVLRLDDDGNGKITWREFKARRAAIERYAYSSIAFQSDGKSCSLKPGTVLITDHADGAYAALSFDVACRPGGRRLAMAYRLFFAVDPSHRAIVVWNSGSAVATALLSPDVPSIGLDRR